jgi:hypothetical protein
LRERDRRRILLDPQPQVFDPLVVVGHGLILRRDRHHFARG